MNRFVTEILPKGLLEAEAKRSQLLAERVDVAGKLDYDSEFSDHSCDCEYCESNNTNYEPLTYTERFELEIKHKKLEVEIADINTAIARMTSYKTFMEKQS